MKVVLNTLLTTYNALLYRLHLLDMAIKFACVSRKAAS